MTDLGKRTRDWLVCLMQYTVGLIAYAIIEVANEIIAIFAWTANIPALVIPGLDFDPPRMPIEVLGWINWIFPLQLLAPLFGAVLSAGAVLRVMRWWSARTRQPIEPS